MLDPSIPRLQSQLQKLPDAQLARLLSGGDTPVPPFLVLAEMERRKSMRNRAQAQTPPGTMVSELTDGGGIAKFAEGGTVESPGLNRVGRYLVSPLWGFMQDLQDTASRNLEDYTLRRRKELGHFDPPRPAHMTPQQIERAVKPAPAPAILVDAAPSGSMGGGIGGEMPSYTPQYIEVPEVRDIEYYRGQLGPTPQMQAVTPEQRDAIRKKLQSEYGYDWSKERQAQDERRQGLAKMKRDGANQALLRLGLGMMATRERNGLAAIGQAGLPALDAYAQAQQAARAEAAAIQRGDLEIARAANAEKLNFLAMADRQAASENDVAFRNAAAQGQHTRSAIDLRRGDIERNEAALRYNLGESNAARRFNFAATRAGRAPAIEMAPSPWASEAFKQASAALEARYAELAARAKKGPQLTREEFAEMNRLADPMVRVRLAGEAAQRVAPMYMKRGGISAIPAETPVAEE